MRKPGGDSAQPAASCAARRASRRPRWTGPGARGEDRTDATPARRRPPRDEHHSGSSRDALRSGSCIEGRPGAGRAVDASLPPSARRDRRVRAGRCRAARSAPPRPSSATSRSRGLRATCDRDRARPRGACLPTFASASTQRKYTVASTLAGNRSAGHVERDLQRHRRRLLERGCQPVLRQHRGVDPLGEAPQILARPLDAPDDLELRERRRRCRSPQADGDDRGAARRRCAAPPPGRAAGRSRPRPGGAVRPPAARRRRAPRPACARWRWRAARRRARRPSRRPPETAGSWMSASASPPRHQTTRASIDDRPSSTYPHPSNHLQGGVAERAGQPLAKRVGRAISPRSATSSETAARSQRPHRRSARARSRRAPPRRRRSTARSRRACRPRRPIAPDGRARTPPAPRPGRPRGPPLHPGGRMAAAQRRRPAQRDAERERHAAAARASGSARARQRDGATPSGAPARPRG